MELSERYPAAPPDRGVRSVTRWVGLIALILAVIGVVSFSKGSSGTGVALVVAALLDAAVLLFFARLVPVAYRIGSDGIVIERRGGEKRLDGAVGRARRVELGRRIAGSGGLGGYIGTFRLPEGGSAVAYVTDLEHVVALPVGERTVALSPGDLDAFVAAYGG